MPTKGERQALVFLAGVLALGASVRVIRAVRPAADQQAHAALDAQLSAVDSARGSARRRTQNVRGKGAKRTSRESGPKRPEISSVSSPRTKVDLDRATAAQIESLPGVGPVLARRVVEDRDRRGPFGGMEAFESVLGVGPALVSRLDSLVTFSAPPRPPSATKVDASPVRTRRRKGTTDRVAPTSRDGGRDPPEAQRSDARLARVSSARHC